MVCVSGSLLTVDVDSVLPQPCCGFVIEMTDGDRAGSTPMEPIVAHRLGVGEISWGITIGFGSG